jgi:hypothetical protein
MGIFWGALQRKRAPQKKAQNIFGLQIERARRKHKRLPLVACWDGSLNKILQNSLRNYSESGD